MGAFHNVGENGNKDNENENNVGESVCQRLFPYIFSVFLAFSCFFIVLHVWKAFTRKKALSY
jgi:hypothetical protein